MMGLLESQNGTIIDPALRKHTAEALKNKAAIAKELRKADEVNNTKPEPKKTPKGGGRGDKKEDG